MNELLNPPLPSLQTNKPPVAASPVPRPTLPQLTSQPARIAVPGMKPAQAANLSSATLANEMLSMMTNGVSNRYLEKSVLPRMNPAARQQYMDRQALQAEAMSPYREGDQVHDQSSPNYISLSVPDSPTHDMHYAHDYEGYAPQTRAIVDKAVEDLHTQWAAKLSGMDKSKFHSEKDVEEALNSLPVVQKYGKLIEGTAYDLARSFTSPKIKAQFEANDENYRSFKSWAAQNKDKLVSPSYGDEQSLHAIWESAQSGHASGNAKAIHDAWKNDPYAVKWDVDPTTGKVKQAAQSRAEIERQRGDEQTAVMKARIAETHAASNADFESKRDIAKKEYQANLDNIKASGGNPAQYMQKSATSGEAVPIQKPKQPDTVEAARARISESGMNPDEFRFVRDTETGSYHAHDQYSRPERDAIGKADYETQAGIADWFAIKSGDKTIPVSATSKDGLKFQDVYEVKDGKRGDKITNATELKRAYESPDEYEFVPKKGVVKWQDRPKQSATSDKPAAQAAPADVPSTNSKGWKLHRDANGNQAYVGPNGEIEEVK